MRENQNWIAFVRHGVTEWNELNRIQGRTDTSLSRRGVEKLQALRPGPEILAAHWVTSPLKRARDTASILNPDKSAEVQPELIETNWGEFEGLQRSELNPRIRELGLQPDHGLDLLPPGGESPRMVRARLVRWVAAASHRHPRLVAVTHKGVIRSVLSAACDWDMEDDFPQKPDWSLPQLFRVDASGRLRLELLNCPWDQAVAGP